MSVTTIKPRILPNAPKPAFRFTTDKSAVSGRRSNNPRYSGGGGGATYTNEASVLFDGADDYATFDSEIIFGGEYTVSFWLKPSTQPWGTLLYGSGGDYVDVYSTNSGGTNYGNKINVRNMGTATSALNSVPVGVWRNVVIIRDSSNVVTIYVQGAASGTTGTFSGDSHFSKIGAYAVATTPFTGNIDEVAFWDSDQTANRTAIYNGGVPGNLNDVSPPLHWYRMGDINGGSGSTPTTIEDVGSAANNPLTLVNGPTYSPKVPYALPPQTNSLGVDFDGTDDYLAIAADASLNTAGNWSFSAWVNADDLSSYEAIAAKRTGGLDWQFAVSGSKLVLYFGSGVTVAGSSTLSTGQWYHVAFTVDVGVTDGVKLFVNGTQENNTTTSSTSYNAGAYGMTIADNTVNRWWDGKMDEIAMFHTCLTAEEIHVIWNDGVPPDIDTLSPVAWWRLGDGTGDTDSGGGTPANADTVGTLVNQGSANTGSGQGNATAGNAPTYTNSIPS